MMRQLPVIACDAGTLTAWIAAGVVLAAGAVESVWGLLQLCGLAEPGHALYAVTGSFFNPGPYGCFLGMTVPLALALALGDGRLLRHIGRACLLLMAAPLSASMSRTGWMAAVAGCLLTWLMMRRGGIGIRLRRLMVALGRRKFRLAVLAVSLAVCGAVCGSLCALYALKPESAQGRLLIWKVGMLTLRDAPLWGVGREYVAGVYGEAQERYFMTHDGMASGEVMVAGAPEYLFNEYLQVGVACGPVAMAGFILLVAFTIYAGIRGRRCGLAGAATAFAIICLASYPLRFPIFMICGTLIAVGCAAGPWTRNLLMRIEAAAVMAVILTLLCVDSIPVPDTEGRARDFFARGLACHRARRYAESDSLMLETLRISSDPMPLNILGKNAQARGLYTDAERYFRRASWRKPSALYPHYLMMLLHAENGHSDRAADEARIILGMPTKVDSPAERDIRKAARLRVKSEELRVKIEEERVKEEEARLEREKERFRNGEMTLEESVRYVLRHTTSTSELPMTY